MSNARNLMSTTPKNPFGEKTVKVRPLVLAVSYALREIGQSADRDRYRRSLEKKAFAMTEKVR